ncbi:MAG: SLC13 family permease, partial [Alphaproteobacteria bacterium]
LAAVLANDILIIAIAPLLIAGARRRGLDPRPFVIALSAATNAGSAATLIGNPQNIVLGAIGRLGFWHFLAVNGVPALFALVSVFAVVWLQWSRRMRQTAAEPGDVAAPTTAHPIDRFQMMKAVGALIVLLLLFSTPLPREIGALIIAALLLANRRITSRTMIATVDWPLLLLVACLFAITGQLNDTGIAAKLLALLSDTGLLPNNLVVLLPFALVTSNLIGSVPAAMLVLQIWPLPPDYVLYSLALLSTLAGNLLLSGSLSTLLVAERAAAMDAPVSFREYARAGVPIAVVSLAFASFWLVAIGILPLTPPPVPPPLP